MIDRWDIMTVAGLATLGTGLWWASPATSLVVVGGLLFAGGVLGARRAARARPPAQGGEG